MTLPGNKKLVCVGSYKLTGRRLGRGNFAKVEEAIHTTLKTKVALKVMNVSEIKEEYVIRNLHREARLMSQLSHPCIVTLYETMQTGPVYYLVTELVGGGDLCTYIKAQRGGRLEEKSTKIFARQLISAVAYMHNMGIVHRDLKMENIMLTESRTHIKIVDFGLSNTYTNDTPLRTHCGSPEYAAPELFVTGQFYGPQVDLWSLGVILYGMVMGQLPFLTSRDSKISSQDRRKHLLQQINRGLAPPHRKALANFSIEFRAMLAQLLMPDPSKRIRIIDLIRHPWLTDRNRRPLRTSGLDGIDSAWKSIIIKEISKLTNTDYNRIEFAIRGEPYGIIAGMYNILVARRMLQMELARKESLTQQIRPVTSMGTQNLPRFATLNRPATACQTSTTPRHILQKQQVAKCWTNDIQGTPSRLRVVGTRNITKVYNLRSNAATKSPPQRSARIQVTNEVSTPKSKPVSDGLVSRRTKSEPIAQSQRITKASALTPNHIVERAHKRKSEQQQQHQQQGRTTCTTTPSGRKSNASSRSGTSRGASNHAATQQRRTAYKTAENRPASTPTEVGRRGHGAAGDGGQHSQVNRKLVNEPIARCIAGYVGKYMNVHGAKFRWIKDFASFNHPGATMITDSK